MKNNTFWLLSLVSISLLSCNRLTQFKLKFDEEMVVPASTGINLPIDILSPDIETNSEQEFEINDTRKDKIESIILTDLEATITQPNGADFSFLESISIYMSAPDLPEIELATKNSIPQNATTLIMDTSGEDMQAYIKKPSYKLRLHAVTDEVISQDHYLNVHQVFFVDAKLVN